MSRMMVMVVVLLPVLLLVCAVPVMLGVYVYRDAVRRGMNALLWTLVTVLAPAFTGFIIYLLVRGSWSNLQCARCGRWVAKEYVVCPQCGAKLRPACTSCGWPVEADWQVCPRCAQPLPENWPDLEPPEVLRDRTLTNVLMVIILVPVLLLAGVSGFAVSTASEGGTSAWTMVSVEDYLESSDHAREVQAWMDTADRSDRAYVLRWMDGSTDWIKTRYLIYVPSMREDDRMGCGVGGGLFGRTLTVKIDGSADNPRGGGGHLLMLQNEGQKPPRLQVEQGGRRLSCVVTDVDWVLELRTAETSIS